MVTFGVPVYNGAGMIGECLDCLVGQTLQDIEIVVSDNASTDDTAAIVAAYAARDPRVRLIRQGENIGLMRNFKAVVDAATSPYFVLRCHDDRSSLNFAEALLGGLRANPHAKLATGTVRTFRKGKGVRIRNVPKLGRGSFIDSRNLLFQSQAAWFCGLWDYAAFKPVFDRVWEKYDSPWGSDHLTLYPFLIARQVALVPEAVFIQQITPKVGEARYAKPDIALMRRLRAKFMDMCADFRGEQNIAGARDAALAALTWLYTGKRVYQARRIWKYSLMTR